MCVVGGGGGLVHHEETRHMCRGEWEGDQGVLVDDIYRGKGAQGGSVNELASHGDMCRGECGGG